MNNEKLSFEIIERAISGEERAIQRILNYFSSYIRLLSRQPVQHDDGSTSYEVNEDTRLQLENALVQGILQFKMRPQNYNK